MRVFTSLILKPRAMQSHAVIHYDHRHKIIGSVGSSYELCGDAMPVRLDANGQLEKFASPEEKLVAQKYRMMLRFWLTGEVIETLLSYKHSDICYEIRRWVHRPFFIVSGIAKRQCVYTTKLSRVVKRVRKDPVDKNTIIGIYRARTPLLLRFQQSKEGVVGFLYRYNNDSFIQRLKTPEWDNWSLFDLLLLTNCVVC